MLVVDRTPKSKPPGRAATSTGDVHSLPRLASLEQGDPAQQNSRSSSISAPVKCAVIEFQSIFFSRMILGGACVLYFPFRRCDPLLWGSALIESSSASAGAQKGVVRSV